MDRDRCRTEVGLGEGPVVCFVGELYPWQGVDVLLRAASLVAREHSDVRFIIVGDGQRRLAAASRHWPSALASPGWVKNLTHRGNHFPWPRF